MASGLGIQSLTPPYGLDQGVLKAAGKVETSTSCCLWIKAHIELIV